jgi:hypothetical protein
MNARAFIPQNARDRHNAPPLGTRGGRLSGAKTKPDSPPRAGFVSQRCHLWRRGGVSATYTSRLDGMLLGAFVPAGMNARAGKR